jgi:hypothetical protein
VPVLIHDVAVPQPPPDRPSSNSENPTPITARTVERLLDRIAARHARLVAD